MARRFSAPFRFPAGLSRCFPCPPPPDVTRRGETEPAAPAPAGACRDHVAADEELKCPCPPRPADVPRPRRGEPGYLDHVAAEARRCLARFGLPDVPGRGDTDPAAPGGGCREPIGAATATATPERPRPAIAVVDGDDARADGDRPSNNIGLLPQQSFLSRSSRPTLGDGAMPPLFPSVKGNGSESVGGPVRDTQPEKEEEPFSHQSERAVFEEYLRSIRRKSGQQDLPEGVMSSLHDYQETEEEDLPKGVLSVKLLKHQKIALAWMLWKENSSHCPGGFLADDQGLGKTISTIALIQKELAKQYRFRTAGSYITKFVPNSDYDNDEDVAIVMEKKEPKDEPLNQQDDSARLHDASSLKLCDSKSNAATDKAEPKNTRVGYSASNLRSKTSPAAGTLVVCPASILKQWHNELSERVMEDNKLSVLVYHGSSRTRDPNELAKYDVVVTTYMTVANEVPKENSNDEQKEGGPLARLRWFRVVLDEAQTIKNYRTQVSRACCGLRAERRWCLSGTPIQNEIDDLYSYFCFLKYEPYSKYSNFKYMIKDQIASDYVRGFMKLQAILTTFVLRRTKETLIDGEPIVKLPPKSIELFKIDFTREERAFYLALEESSRQKFKEYDAAGTIRKNYTEIFVLLLRLRQACDHPLLVNRQEPDLIDSSSIERAKQLSNEIVKNLLEKLEKGPAICSVCNDSPENAVVTTCGHVFCYQCVHESLTSDGHACCPYALCGKKLSFRSVFTPAVLKLCTSPKLEFHEKPSCFTAAGKPSSICESSYISSKIRVAVEMINSIIKKPALTSGDTTESIPSMALPVKAIVFSQWTGMLDLLELSLNRNEIQFRRLDGAMSLNLRERQVNEFKTDPEVSIMLMSLKAGNLGLNMVAACHVIMLDPWWNPYAEDQAVDRAHRIGQTRSVTVSRFTVKDTVEDRILALQAKKRRLVESAFGEDTATRLTEEDLRDLFMV